MSLSEQPAGLGLALERIFHQYGETPVVDDVSIALAPGELVALLGPSGCGKTTLLKIIAGFQRQNAGIVRIGNAPVDNLPPNRRRVGIVFQNYALFPHMTRGAKRRLWPGCDARRPPRRSMRAWRRCSTWCRWGAVATDIRGSLSGGQQQRVAIARALAVQPSILLLDEPFAALDKALRLDMQIELKRIQRNAGTTTIIVTHDQEEALSMADRVALLNRGKLEQFAAPTEIYDHPASLFVNTFVGTANVLDGTVASTDGDLHTDRAVGRRHRAGVMRRSRSPGRQGARSACGPKRWWSPTNPDGLPATVEVGLPLGSSIIHELRLADGTC